MWRGVLAPLPPSVQHIRSRKINFLFAKLTAFMHDLSFLVAWAMVVWRGRNRELRTVPYARLFLSGLGVLVGTG